MQKKSFKLNGIAIGILVVIQEILTFLPFFYDNGAGRVTSIQGFIWLYYADFKTFFEERIPDYFLTDHVLFPVLLLLLGILVAVLGFIKPNSIATYILTYIWAIIGVLAFVIPKTVAFGNMALIVANFVVIGITFIVAIIAHIGKIKADREYVEE